MSKQYYTLFRLYWVLYITFAYWDFIWFVFVFGIYLCFKVVYHIWIMLNLVMGVFQLIQIKWVDESYRDNLTLIWPIEIKEFHRLNCVNLLIDKSYWGQYFWYDLLIGRVQVEVHAIIHSSWHDTYAIHQHNFSLFIEGFILELVLCEFFFFFKKKEKAQSQ